MAFLRAFSKPFATTICKWRLSQPPSLVRLVALYSNDSGHGVSVCMWKTMIEGFMSSQELTKDKNHPHMPFKLIRCSALTIGWIAFKIYKTTESLHFSLVYSAEIRLSLRDYPS